MFCITCHFLIIFLSIQNINPNSIDHPVVKAIKTKGLLLTLNSTEDKKISLSRPAYYVTNNDIHPSCPYGEKHLTEIKEDRYLVKLCPSESTKNGQFINASHFNLYPESFKNDEGQYEGITLSILEALEPFMKFQCNNVYGEYSYTSLNNDVRDGIYDTGSTYALIPER